MDQHSEKWRPVVGYEGAYEVSDQGRVRSVDRLGSGRWGERVYRGRVLRGSEHPVDHHVRVCLYRDGARERVFIHRLVLDAFVGPQPVGMEACHNNGDPTDNALRNLRWDTHSENLRDKRKHGTDHYANRDACSRGHVYTEETTRRIGGARYCLVCAADAARQRRATPQGAEAHRLASRNHYWRAKSRT